MKLVEDLACYFPNTDSALGYRLLHAWERSAQLNNFAHTLRDISWFTLLPKTAYRLFQLILDVCWYYEDSRQYGKPWDVFRRELSHIERLIRTLPVEYQARAIDELSRVHVPSRRRFGLTVPIASVLSTAAQDLLSAP